jgi:hypothetical protein
MDRFTEQSPADAARNYRLSFDPDAASATYEQPLECESCGARVPELFLCTWDETLMVGSCCIEPDTEQSTGCLALDAVLMAVLNLDGVCEALEAHRAECVHCGSSDAIVQSDRRYLNPAAVCCEAKAA